MTAEKMWNGEPFWGLGLRVRPAVGADRRAEGAAGQAHPGLRRDAAAQRRPVRHRPGLPARELREAGRTGPARPVRPAEVGRAGREPRLRRHGGGDHRPLRLPLDRHVLHHAPGRGRRPAVPGRPEPGVHPAAGTAGQGRADRDAVLLRPGDGVALLVPRVVERRAGRGRLEGQQEGVVDHVGGLRGLLRRADDQPGLPGQLLGPVVLSGLQRRGQGRAAEVGRPGAARQPVRHAAGGQRDSPRPAHRRPGRRRRHVQRRDRGPVLSALLVLLLERHRPGRDRHRQGTHDQEEARGCRECASPTTRPFRTMSARRSWTPTPAAPSRSRWASAWTT